MTARRVAAIDCGTNTIRLLIADIAPETARPVREVVRQMRTVRLGEGIERTGEFAAAALERTRVALDEYAALIQQHAAQQVRMVATSASRDVRTRGQLIEIARSTVEVVPEVITGDEEGRLSFTGVLSGLRVPGPSIVVDIGGGSTELVAGSESGVRANVSTDIGVVRLTERHVRHDPPRADELARVAADAEAALRTAADVIGEVGGHRMIGVAGTATTAAALARDLSSYDPRLIHGATISYADVRRVLHWSTARDTAGRAAHPAMHPGRAPVFPAGMVILDCVMSMLQMSEMTVSESDILDGIALSTRPGE
ncbi:exopolyphosphatase [Blastococcus sp. Marseille-P5729]|uniref:Ppx/GppA phosphatase family protein n=1 Tax=Blastococcus sp. Marseille-P5729 TaxID=2086582 RepID=UPI000D0F3578|nr:exopolyphosphatase [Blastococcus sp. Marseille-P5729]